jgi:hypothetical protein
MAKIHKISGYVVDVHNNFTEIGLEVALERMAVHTQQLHVETADIGEWEDNNPLNYSNCDLAECEKWFSKEPTRLTGVRKIEAGSVYRHFKGHKVLVLCIAKDTEYPDHLQVIYRHVETGDIWSRPYDMFASEVDHEKYPEVTQKYRFEKVEE